MTEKEAISPRTVVQPTAPEPVYAPDDTAVLGQHLVLTPYMLLDQLKQCQEQAEHLLYYVHRNGVGVEQKCGLQFNPVAERLEDIHFSVGQILRLLWRNGLWTAEELETVTDTTGKTYYALRAPFTDGKPHGRPLPPDAPEWQRELLGLSTATEEIPTPARK